MCPLRYHPATTRHCHVCAVLKDSLGTPVVEKFYPQQRANEVAKQRVHNWYVFTLSFSPRFVTYELKKKHIQHGDAVLDPFVGMGTTLVECKLNGIDSMGIDANDFAVFASNVKTDWDVDVEQLRRDFLEVDKLAAHDISNYRWSDLQRSITEYVAPGIDASHVLLERPELLREEYVSPKPLAKLLAIKRAISSLSDGKSKNLLRLALAAILIPSSNVRFGPGFGLTKPVDDVDVMGLFRAKVRTIISDLECVQGMPTKAGVLVKVGDTRKLSELIGNRKFDLAITSPPYPGDHEYTRHTRLELAFLDFASSVADLRTIKKRMIRGSTRNIYHDDNERQLIMKFERIVDLMKKIDRRVRETKGKSGFEKLYGKLVGEYYGGMYKCLQEVYDCLESRGTAAFLVGDSHAFKMVHIETAKLLGEIGLDVGFKKYEIELWQNKRSTSHSLPLPENILELYK